MEIDMDEVEAFFRTFPELDRGKKKLDGMTCMHVAAIRNAPGVMQWFLSQPGGRESLNIGVGDEADATPMLWALTNAGWAAAEWLHEQGVDWAKDDYIFKMAAGGKVPAIRFLVGKGIDLNARCNGGRSLLHVAAINGQIEAIKWLVEKQGQDIRVVDDRGLTPLDQARKADNPAEVVEWLTAWQRKAERR